MHEVNTLSKNRRKRNRTKEENKKWQYFLSANTSDLS